MAPTQQQIYARRRALLLLVLVVVGVLVWNAFSGGSQPQQAGPTSAASVSATASTPASEIVDCQPGVVEVFARIGDKDGEKSSFASGEKPYLWYDITNTGPVDCNFNVGSRVTFFTITSGDETYYSSRDCDRSADQDLVTVLKANSTISSSREGAIWERVRSSGTGCGAEQEPVPSGGASYFLKVEVNGVYSENPVQFLLN
jgi:hypothetical protein